MKTILVLLVTWLATPLLAQPWSITVSNVTATGTYTGNGAGVTNLNPINITANYALYQDIKSAGTHGGDSVISTWTTRVLNTEVVDGIGITLATNAITVPAGTYHIVASAPGVGIANHQIRLYNVTDAAAVLYGQNNYAIIGGGSSSTLVGQFTIAASKALRIEHNCGRTESGFGFGFALNAGGSEIYTQVELWKIR